MNQDRRLRELVLSRATKKDIAEILQRTEIAIAERARLLALPLRKMKRGAYRARNSTTDDLVVEQADKSARANGSL